VQRTSSVSRVLGRTAVGAVVAAATLVPAGGAPAWAQSPAAVWTVDTSAPSGLLPLGGGGWAATVPLVVHSTPTVLGSLVADDGSFDTSVTLPAGLPAGEHTLVATGVSPDGETWTLTRQVTAQGATAGPAAPASTVATAVPSGGGLAYTGAYVGMMAIGGVLTLVVGIALVLLGRRRRSTGRG
jgi:hypothetical protein